MKFDKDMLIKHRFWVLLGVSVPLILAAIFILITAVSAENEKRRKDLDDKLKAVAKPGTIVGPNTVDELGKSAESWKKSETLVHAAAFEKQKVISTWPKSVEDRFDFQNGWFATEVKVLPPKGKDKAGEWPADDVHLVHGIVKIAESDFLIVEVREAAPAPKETKEGEDKEKAVKFKEVKIYPTLNVKMTRQEKKEGEREEWGALAPKDFVAVTYYKSKYFYDKLTRTEQEEFVRSYLSQIRPILEIVEPVDTKGEGVVQLGSWLYNKQALPDKAHKFITFVPEQWQADSFIYEEAWLAQEDLWVQRELYTLIREANDLVSKCKGTPVEGKKPAVFANPYYELKFEWEGEKLFATVKNQLPRRQKLDVHFRVKFNKLANAQNSTEVVMLGGEPLDPPGMPKSSQKVEVNLERGSIQRTGIYEVEQVLTWETAAVKRIDRISMGSVGQETAHSHRTYAMGSQPYRKEEAKAETNVAADNPMAAGQLAAQAAMMGGGDRKDVNLTLNGLLKDRYLEVSEQSRRIPVGLSLIVDQEHIDRVLTAFSNSRLRFLTTQVLLNRYAGSVRPQLTGGGAEAGNLEDEIPLPAPMPMGFRPRGFEGFPGAGGFPMGGMPGAAVSSSVGDDVESNVEMVLYGIVTLYERYPKRTIPIDAKDAK
jgi:hypothetical protein